MNLDINLLFSYEGFVLEKIQIREKLIFIKFTVLNLKSMNNAFAIKGSKSLQIFEDYEYLGSFGLSESSNSTSKERFKDLFE